MMISMDCIIDANKDEHHRLNEQKHGTYLLAKKVEYGLTRACSRLK